MKKPKGDYAIQTVVNAMRLLEAFRDEEELGVTELSRRLSLHKNNVFRLLATLEARGYIEQSSVSDLSARGEDAELGQAFLRGRTLLRRARADPGESGERVTRVRAPCDAARLRSESPPLDGALGDQLVLTRQRVGERLPALHRARQGADRLRLRRRSRGVRPQPGGGRRPGRPHRRDHRRPRQAPSSTAWWRAPASRSTSRSASRGCAARRRRSTTPAAACWPPSRSRGRRSVWARAPAPQPGARRDPSRRGALRELGYTAS